MASRECQSRVAKKKKLKCKYEIKRDIRKRKKTVQHKNVLGGLKFLFKKIWNNLPQTNPKIKRETANISPSVKTGR
jgi:hypothetical protein